MSNKPLTLPDISTIIKAALAEDIGAGDITSELTIPADATATMAFIAGEPLVACGTAVPGLVYTQIPSPACGGGLGRGRPFDEIKIEIKAAEGQILKPGDTIAIATGNARILLTGERVALNLMQRMSGVATLTKQYVDAVAGTKAKILDTRKTMPGLRLIDKYAVKIGGGENHRMRLDDMVLIKDNHIAICGGIAQAIQKIKLDSRFRGNDGIKIIVECDTLAQFDEALAAKPDRILLDNMSLADMREAVKRAAGKVKLEASGGVSLETVRAIAETGVDYISVGKLTHSAPAADIRADMSIKTLS